MKKKILALLLLTVMVISLTACGTTEAPSEPQTAPEAETEEEVLPEEVPSEEETVPDAPAVEEDPVQPAPEEAEASSDKLDLASVRTAMIEELEINDPFLLETDALLDLYGIGAEAVAQSASFVTMAGTFPDEIILIEAVDEASASAIAEALQHRLDEVMVQSEAYDAENYAAAQKCEVLVNDLFVSLILSPKQAEMTAIYAEYIG